MDRFDKLLSCAPADPAGSVNAPHVNQKKKTKNKQQQAVKSDGDQAGGDGGQTGGSGGDGGAPMLPGSAHQAHAHPAAPAHPVVVQQQGRKDISAQSGETL